MAYRLRYLAHDLELPIGEFVVGRSTDCQLSLDDPLVSRRHAVLRVGREIVTVQDLGSRNGVLVNGTKIEGERELAAGDRVGIGSQEMVLHSADEAHPASTGNEEVYRRATQTLGAAYVVDLRNAIDGAASVAAPLIGERVADPPTAEASRSMQSFQLLGGVADKALAMNRAEDAERILQALLLEVLNRARDGQQPLDPTMVETAALYGARLAGATSKGAWVDYVIDLYKRVRRPVPATVAAELYTVVRKAKSIDLGLLRAYLAEMQAASPTFGPADQFLIKRIEGLERIVALK